MSNATYTLLATTDINIIQDPARTHDLGDAIVKERAADLEHNGLLNIPTAYRLADGLIYLGDGATRFYACCELEENGSTIAGIPAGQFPVMLIDAPEMEEVDILVAQVLGNLTAEKMTNKQTVDAMYRVKCEKNPSTAELAKMFGKSPDHVLALMKTLRLPNEIREEIENTISFNNAKELEKVQSAASHPAYGENGVGFTDLVDQARELSNADFKPMVEKFLADHKETVKAFRKEKGAGSEDSTAPVFTPKEKIMGRKELLIYRDEVNENGTEEEIEIMNHIFGVSATQIEAQKAKWLADQEAKAEKVKTRKKASKKLEDYTDEELAEYMANRAANSEA